MTDAYIRKLLGEQETVLLAIRQHWFMLFGAIFLEVVLISVLIGLAILFSVLWPAAAFLHLVLMVLTPILVLILLVTLIRDILVWSNRQYIVTNRRVIQVNGIINKNVTDSSLEKVNDVKMIQSFWGRLFGFGDIEILTASEMGVNVFRRIGNPIRFKIAMLNAKEQLGHSENGISVAAPSRSVPQLILELDDLRRKGVITEAEFQQKKQDLLNQL
ncbi:MAG TPA: PH domain-containing protein [Anaerolineaceae bacterium]|nr:PH domain-containing protein [Anaerolineaceae bacterium]